MTGPELSVALNHIAGDCVDWQHEHPLTSAQLMTIMYAIDRLLKENITDPDTPCDHSGSRYQMIDGERCGICTRRVGEVLKVLA